MSDEQDKSYVEELSDMWNENGWLLDAIGGKDMVQQDSFSDNNTFNYFEEVAKAMQPNTSQPAAMVASSVANSNIQYNTALFSKMGSMGDYFKKIFKAEAGGKLNAKNPFGTAYGPYQFIASTWKNLCRKYGLNYTLADRGNMQKATHVMQLFTEENRRGLRKVLDREPGHGELYLAHFIGLGGAQKFLRHSDNEYVNNVFSRSILKANPGYCYDKKRGRYRTVGELKQLLGEKMR